MMDSLRRGIQTVVMSLLTAFIVCGCDAKFHHKNRNAYPMYGGESSLSGLNVRVAVQKEKDKKWKDIYATMYQAEVAFHTALKKRLSERYDYQVLEETSSASADVLLVLKLEEIETKGSNPLEFLVDLPGFALLAPGWYARSHEVTLSCTVTVIDGVTDRTLQTLRLPMSIEADYRMDVSEGIAFAELLFCPLTPLFALTTLGGVPHVDEPFYQYVGDIVAEQFAEKIHTYLKQEFIEVDAFDYTY